MAGSGSGGRAATSPAGKSVFERQYNLKSACGQSAIRFCSNSDWDAPPILKPGTLPALRTGSAQNGGDDIPIPFDKPYAQ